MASKDTDLAESAQALFCALVDHVGISNMDKVLDENSNYIMFKENWEKNKLTKGVSIKSIFDKHVVAGKTTFDEIEKFLTYGKSSKLADSWYKSSVLIAKELLREIDKISRKFSYVKTSSWRKIIYAHQDNIIMDNIQKLFSEANKNQKSIKSEGSKGQIPFGDINKWSPADIYLASDKGQKEIQDRVDNRKGLTFVGLNGLNGTNRIFAAQTSNLFFGTDLLGEEDNYEIFYAKEAMEVRYNVAFKAGVQIAFPEEIVKFTLA